MKKTKILIIGSGSVLKNNITLSKKNFIKMGRVIKKNR